MSGSTPSPVSAPPFLRITEIFHSLQGESTWAGLPCVFVRLTGCPLRCVWCDTEYAFHGGTRMTFAEIEAAVAAFGTRLVEVTGGEPLAHPGAYDLVRRLLDAGYTVLVETSGAFDVAPLDPRAVKVMDLKCPGSGESARTLWGNLDHLTRHDELKFVVADLEDLAWAEARVREHGLDTRVREGRLAALLVSPVWDRVGHDPEGSPFLRALSERILASGLPFRLQLQLHKAVWGPSAKGV